MKRFQYLFVAMVLVCGISLAEDFDSAENRDTFQIGWSCQGTPTCPAGQPAFTQGTAQVGSQYYAQYSDPSTCCRIASQIWTSICQDGNNPMGVNVACQ